MLRWLFYLPALILTGLLKHPLALIAPLFARPLYGAIENNNGHAVEPRLPDWLSWFGTDDNSLWGDTGHKLRVADYRSWFGMVQWLWRNGFHGFNYRVLGCDWQPLQDRRPGEYFWRRPDGYWLLRRYFPIIWGRQPEVFIGWNLYGNVNGRCKYVCSIRFRRKPE